MQNTPPNHDNYAQKQLFIVTVSNLVNIDLSPFFSKWGLDADLNTLSNISFLPKLEKDIWENTNDDHFKLSMPEPICIPELIYLKNSITNVSVEKDVVRFTIDKDWYSPYDYTFKRNGMYVGSIIGGQDYYCYSTLTDNGYQISRSFTDDELSESDIFSIEVDFQGKHVIYYSSIEINRLWEKVRNIYTDDSFTRLKSEVMQDDIDELWELYNSLSNDYTLDLRYKIIFSQQLLISAMIVSDGFDQSSYIVRFNTISFKNYQFKAISDNNVIAKLNIDGISNSSINWEIPININSYSRVDILVRVHEHDFISRVGFVEGSLLEAKIDALYSQKENEILKDSVNQTELDNLINSILDSNLPLWKKNSLLDELDVAQRIYLASAILDTYVVDTEFYVVFNDDNLFRDYRYMLFSSGVYISEVSYGGNYYSSLNGTTWTSNIRSYDPKSLSIRTPFNDRDYVVYQASSEFNNVVHDFPES